MHPKLALFLYSMLWWPVATLALIRLYLKSLKQPSYRKRIKERFGVWPSMPTGSFWVHAVSVGEVIACKELVEQWMLKHPNTPVLITTMTPTGSDTVKKLFAGRVFHAYLPWDFQSTQRRLVQQLKPCSLTIMETELWPNLIHACYAEQVPVIVANARLSERSFRGYRRFSALTQPMLQRISGIAAQHAPDAERFARLGVHSKCLQVTGSIKFDIAPNDALQADIKRWKQSLNGRPTWTAASTHPGEEAILLEVHQHIVKQIPNALLLLVPRHIERSDKISELIRQQGFQFSKRSVDTHCSDRDSVFLVDTLGELMLFYGIADAAFIGNSLNNGGGHNPIEPASLAVPVISGNSYVNFQTIFDAMKLDNAAIIVDTPEQLTQRILGLFKSRDLRDTFGQKAFQFYQQQQGALGRLITWVEVLTRTKKLSVKQPKETL
ncbi:lipid IV(A) 3-deoxy-D-manno-octulosonic acid transferase [Reinekea forsetii]|nr:lipid IV(A) 3-deoxy-D-manno-octulosonic acid transferase [Reinekea forsetii]